MVGVVFLQKLFSQYQDMENQHILDRKAGKPTMYLLDCYNVIPYCYTHHESDTPVVTQMVNETIEALNTRNRLLTHLIVIVDKDVIADQKSLDYKDACGSIATDINWMVKQISIAIKRKCLKLLERR